MDETNELSAEEELEKVEQRRKELRVQVKGEREIRLENATKMRTERDINLGKIQEILKKVQAAIHIYNKLGKVAKSKYDVFEIISNVLNPKLSVVVNSEN